MEQTALHDALAFDCKRDGKYIFKFPRSLRVGIVTTGGLLGAAAQVAARHFVVTNTKLTSNAHLMHSSVYFFRPVLTSPKQTFVNVGLKNASKIWITLQLDILQDEKLCVSSTLIFSDLTLPGRISGATGWSLLPPPAEVSVASLEADEVADWVSFRTPFTPQNIRNPASYIIFHVPIHRPDQSSVDQWVTPAWKDSSRPSGAVWTNEILDFVTDNHLPHWHNHVGADVVSYCRYDAVVAAGLEQRRLRKANQSDMIFGENCGPLGPVEFVSSTVYISLEIRKPLPQEGTKWLFMRAVSIKLENNRLTEQVYVLDTQGDLVAIMTQHIHTIPMTSKMTSKTAKI